MAPMARTCTGLTSSCAATMRRAHRGLCLLVSLAVFLGGVERAEGQLCQGIQQKHDLVIIVATDGTSNVAVLNELKAFLQILVSGFPQHVRAGLIQTRQSQATSSYDFAIITPIESNRTALQVGVDNLQVSGGQRNIASSVSAAVNMFQIVADPVEIQSVFVIVDPRADGAQLDLGGLSAPGKNLFMLWIGQDLLPTSLSSLATRSQHVLSYNLLAGAVGGVRDLLEPPCPCLNGTSVTIVGPDGLLGGVTLATNLASGGSRNQDCSRDFPGYKGVISLTCEGSVLRATHNCIHQDSCWGGTDVNLALQGTVDATQTQDIVPASNSDVAGVMRMRACHGTTIDSNINLMTHSGGLAHSLEMSRTCEEQFPNADLIGEFGLLCLRGRLYVFGECACTRDQVITVEDEKQFWTFWTAFALVAGGLTFLVVVIAVLCVVCKRSKPVHPFTSFRPDPFGPWVDVHEKHVQTTPQVFVELTRGSQCPLDLILCIDSSMSVGVENFLKSKRFAERLVGELELPPVKVGVIRFHHEYDVISPLTPQKETLLSCLSEMGFDPGETKLGPVLNYALAMLQASMDASSTARDRAVVVVTDGDPNDMPQSVAAAQALKEFGVNLVFVRVGCQASYEVVAELASQPASKYVINLGSYNELEDSVEDVLRAAVQVSMWIKRAKCNVDLWPYQTVEDITTVPGYDMLVPGWQQHGPDWWFWEPRDGICWQHEENYPWEPHHSTTIGKLKYDGLVPGPSRVPLPSKVLALDNGLYLNPHRKGATLNKESHLPFGQSLGGSTAREPAINLTFNDSQEAVPSGRARSRSPSPPPPPNSIRHQDLLDMVGKSRLGIIGDRGGIGGFRDIGIRGEEYSVDRLRRDMENRYGSIRAAFQNIDDNQSNLITVSKLLRNLDQFGVTRSVGEDLFRQLVKLAGCEKCGAMNFQDWCRAFGTHSPETIMPSGEVDRRVAPVLAPFERMAEPRGPLVLRPDMSMNSSFSNIVPAQRRVQEPPRSPQIRDFPAPLNANNPSLKYKTEDESGAI